MLVIRTMLTVTVSDLSTYFQCLFGQMTVLVCVSSSGMTIPDEDTEAGQTSKYCLVAIGRLQVCVPNLNAQISDICGNTNTGITNQLEHHSMLKPLIKS